MHSKMQDPEIPEGVALFGTDNDAGTCTMLYFDERNVSRTMEGKGTMRKEGAEWEPDLSLSYVRDGETP
jgi:hypothetical protein